MGLLPIYRRSDHGAFAHLSPKRPWVFCPSIAEATMGLLPIYRRSDHGAFAHLSPKRPWVFCPSIAEATMGLLPIYRRSDHGAFNVAVAEVVAAAAAEVVAAAVVVAAVVAAAAKNWIRFSKIEKSKSCPQVILLPTLQKVNPQKKEKPRILL
uniref:Uncharacterized protein n=1 Tax=Meloidogyne enterolobii TaxID=390850 RepID=A0A6V7WXQ8_MELEN|nr:unnamed protein product [Meloidogyne enterolobii]